ncbi:DUF58 domain-containing protein [Georgenia subflava]|uniref:DUF58 domain-containing protein n=1 Tax=Georgenia subflava TaxID=1622177 RepID=A0A6N7ETG0_9MICO|nr:DUF58 domain-containing protein [Georgenia subflava]MPV38464.1 DUF58 domain-containing protein [Georgenia subflava]
MNAPRLTMRGRTFLAAGVLVVVAATLLGFPDVTRIGVLLAVLPLLACLSIWRRAPRLAVARHVAPVHLQRGEDAHVRLELRNDGRRATLPHLAEEHVDPALGAPARFVLPRMAPQEVQTLTYPLHATVRGSYHLGPVRLGLTDPFGMAGTVLTLRPTAEVLVLPRVEPIDGPGLRRQGGTGDWPVPHMVATQGEDDVSTRTYRVGDDLRRIHWPATAHRAELMVRQEERPARRRAVLVLDSRRTAHRGHGDGSSFEWAVSAVASVAVHLAAQGYSLQLVSTETVRDGRAGEVLGVDVVLRYLAVALPEAGDLEPVLRAARSSAPGALIAVVADEDAEALHQLARARGSGTTGILLVLRTDTFAPGTEPRPTAELVGIARQAGWRTEAVDAETSVRTVWHHLARSRETVR